ncbi:MAG: hypothetical protein E6G36_00505 [Actinobacteria bacterium]|nr:MAG: hypothetical protein E6G36_00505 [Actinomycetota bacterium]
MHAITKSPASSAAWTRLATVSSVSPKYCLRSECPTIAPYTPSSRSISAETSPVYAPSASQCTFCAATAISVPASSWTATASETNGGHTTRSTPVSSCSRRPRQNSAVSAGPLYIFQLPAISI